VARQGDIVQVQVVGRATYKVSRELQEFGLRALREGAATIIFDLSKCVAMDSTFLGVMAMIGLEARREKRAVIVVNIGKSLRDLLDTIGVSRVVSYAPQPVPEVNWRTLCTAASGAVAMGELGDTVLRAHQTLMEMDSENVPKFKDVVEMLSVEVNAIQRKGS